MTEPTVILIVGEPNSGKSVSAGTFPKPMLFIDFGGGETKSMDNARGKDGKLIVSDKDKITIETLKKSKTYSLDFKTTLKGRASPDYASEANAQILKLNGLIKSVTPGKYRTVVFDPLTTMFRLWKEAILFMNSQPSLQIQDYMTLENVLYSQFIPSMKALPVDYVILINHTNIDKDEISGRVSEFPVGPSVNMGRNLPQVFDEVWRQDIMGDNYVWRTRKSGLFVGAGSRMHLPDPINPATYSELKKHCPSLP